LSLKQGVEPQQEVANLIKGRFGSSAATAAASETATPSPSMPKSVRAVSPAEMRQLTDFVSRAWEVLQPLFVEYRQHCRSNSSGSNAEEGDEGGGGGVGGDDDEDDGSVISKSASNAASAQRQTRLKQFFYGLVFLLRQGLTLDNGVVAIERLQWLDELPELSALMQYANAGKHKLLTDGRNAIVAALRHYQQTNDRTLRGVLQRLYPVRY
jgi:hypothetical protein